MQSRPARWWGWGSAHAACFRGALCDEPRRLLRELRRTLDPKGIVTSGKLSPVGG